jgi:enoyl-CoA hydratase/carnithine racemase
LWSSQQRWTPDLHSKDHTQFVDTVYRIGQDRAYTIVIFTGGGHFIAGIDFSSFGNVAEPAVWS